MNKHYLPGDAVKAAAEKRIEGVRRRLEMHRAAALEALKPISFREQQERLIALLAEMKAANRIPETITADQREELRLSKAGDWEGLFRHQAKVAGMQGEDWHWLTILLALHDFIPPSRRPTEGA